MALSLVPTLPSPPALRPTRRALFIDKDGTLVEDLPYNVDPSRLRFTPFALQGLRLLAAHGYLLIVVTNQPGLALGRFDRAALRRLQTELAALMDEAGVPLTDFYVCPHMPGRAPLVAGCLCRKPAPGLLRQAAQAHHIDLKQSWMVGDILDDVEAGHRAGCRTVFLDVGHETEWRRSPLRRLDLVASNLLEAAQLILATRRPFATDTAPGIGEPA